MGWFDESDEEDEKDQQNVKLTKEAAKEEEEDPLDAFMKTLQPSDTDTAASNNKASRLDLDNEEEATGHWEEQVNHCIKEEEEDDREETLDSAGALQTKQALASTFHKAGGQKKEDHWGEKFTALDHLQQQQQYDAFEKNFWTVQDTKGGHEWRKTHHVTCSRSIDPMVEFEALQSVAGQSLVSAIQKAGFSSPTDVQSQTLPVALSGQDAVITAATGQGKTLAYIWPATVHIQNQSALEPGETGPMVLILVPTRELALQVHKQAKPMLQAIGASTKAVIGGQGKYLLQQELKRSKGVQLVVATPGRLVDVLSDKKGLSLNRVTFCVLDEADKMLQMGFEAQVRQILSRVRRDRQTLLLSATMGRKIEKVAKEWLQPNYVRISVGRTGESSRNVAQHAMVLPNSDAKHTFLLEMLPTFKSVGRTLVFVATREYCESLATLVRERLPQITVDTLHGDKHQTDRNAALKDFSRGKISVLIATDVASRGLDVPSVSTVINFDAPKNLDVYVHRIGRAGRLQHNEQQMGSAYSLLTPQNADFALVLRNAFEREGRVVSPELDELAQKSRRSGNVASRNRWNKSGLGFDDGDKERQSNQSLGTPLSKGREHSSTAPASSHYGPASDTSAPPAKRSRWS